MPRGPVLRRRTALLGAAATVLVAGCDHGDDIGEPATSTGPSATTASPTASSSAPEQTPDELIVDQVTAHLVTALAVAINSRKAPELRRAMVPLIKAHRRHIRVLEGELPPEAPPGPPPDPSVSLRQVRRGEEALQAALVDAATRAESGALAKLLASMSASVTQQLAVLPQQVDG